MSPGKPHLVGGSQPEELPPSPTQTESGFGLRAVPWLDERKRSYVALLLLTAGALFIAYIIYRPFLKSLFLALVLAIAFLPVHEQVSRRVRGNTLAALITTTIVVLVIMVPLMLMSVRLVSEAASLYNYISLQGGAAWANRSELLNDAVQRAAEQTGIPPAQIKSTITTRAQEFGSWLVGMVGWAARGFAQQLGTAILTLLVLFFFLRDREQYTRGIVEVLPLPAERVRELSATLQSTVVANLYGMVAVGLIQGGLTAFAWWVTGLRAPLLWGAIATIFSFVPLLGPSLVWIPGALVLALQGRWVQAAVLCAWGAVVVSSADYVVRPRFARGRANVNTLLVLLSLLGGLKAFGAIGIIAGPVVLSVVIALLKIVREEREGRTTESAQDG
jgi:predicted PurR-regulated permease PerM